MALTKEDLQAIGALLEPINERLDRMEKKMDDGFDRLEDLINVAAKDAAKTEKALREHMDQPHIA